MRTYRAPDGTQVQYVLVVPEGRAAGAPGKVLLAFPPGGQDLDLTRRIVEDSWRTEALRRDWVVASPAAGSAGLYYEPTAAALVPGLLDEVARTYPPEGGRFDLAGVSNGGLSAFRAAQDHPDRFRSLVVFPGMPPDESDTAALARLKGLGTAFFVGADDSGWLEGSRRAAAALRAMGNRVELTEVPDQGHIIETLTGADLFDAMERVRG
ncbi:MAG: alpha/beta hydrolase [Actinobacteria bacterium]|nr:alpha/beta hydrolase [Actinomycetota bacterium]